jgi:CO/xanthine dehydrogenase Mo-binding subunit
MLWATKRCTPPLSTTTARRSRSIPIEGGSAQGLGLALLEEVQVIDGKVKNPSFTDYLIPTILDMPPMRISLLESPHPDSPYGLNGVGEPPTLSSTPAIANAVRAATGLDLCRVPIRPDDIAFRDAKGLVAVGDGSRPSGRAQ